MSENELTRQQALYPTMTSNKLTGKSHAQVEQEMFSSAFDELVGVDEVNIRQEMRSLAGKMMHHHDREVREIAATLLRCVERLETGK